MDTRLSCRGTSVSTVRTKTCLRPLSSACWTCTAILVSASRWRSNVCISLEPLFVTTEISLRWCLLPCSRETESLKPQALFARRAKSSFLYVLTAETLSSLEESWFHLSLFLSDHYLAFLWSNLWYYSPYIYPKQWPPIYLTEDDSEWMGWRRFQHSYQMWKQLWMEEDEQLLLHQRSYSHRIEVDSAVLYWQA